VAGCGPAAAYAKAFCNFQALLTKVKMTNMLQKCTKSGSTKTRLTDAIAVTAVTPTL
jgi:hypothetical protein